MEINFNILAYTIYGILTAFLIIRVGWVFYVNGAHYLVDIFQNDDETAHTLNRLLLLGYYLLNLGYVALSLSYWPHINNYVELIELIAERAAFITLGLALMHYINMAWVHLAKRIFTTN